MKLATVINEKGDQFIGVAVNGGQQIIHLADFERSVKGTSTLPKEMIECIEMGEEFINRVNGLLNEADEDQLIRSSYSIDQLSFLAPIPRPLKNVFCIGKNYREHAIEMGSEADIPEDLIVFTKAPTSIIGHGANILSHKNVTSQLDYEGELAIVIGKKGKGIKKEEAFDYIFGYTILNDITARDLQSKHKQFFLGKSLDGSCPIGPWIVDKSEIDNPEELNIKTLVNGEVRQASSTNQFIFPIAEIIETLSNGMTLEPGDIIATGTPSGVGKGFNPPRFLSSGDKIEITIDKIGTLVNIVQ